MALLNVKLRLATATVGDGAIFLQETGWEKQLRPVASAPVDLDRIVKHTQLGLRTDSLVGTIDRYFVCCYYGEQYFYHFKRKSIWSADSNGTVVIIQLLSLSASGGILYSAYCHHPGQTVYFLLLVIIYK